MLLIKSTAILLLLLTFCACSEKKETDLTYFPKPPKEKFDSVGTWLLQDSNYLKDTYLPFFQTHFDQQIAANNLDSAARLLGIAGYVAYNNFAFDTILIKTHSDFLAKYETHIQYRFRADLYNNLGDFYSRTDTLEKSLFFYRQNNAPSKNYYDAFGNAVANEGIMYYFTYTTHYDSILLFGLKAINFYEKYEDWAGASRVYEAIFLNHNSMEDNFVAEKYAHLAITSARKAKDSTLIFRQMMYLTRYFFNADTLRFLSSVDSLEQFNAQWQSKDLKYNFATQSAKTLKLLIEKKGNEAEKLLKNLTPLYPLIKDEDYGNYYCLALSEYELENQKPLTMASYYLKTAEEFKSVHTGSPLAEYYSFLAEDATNKKDYKAAFDYYKKCIDARDSLRNNKIRYEATELEKKYQTEKKEAQLKQQAADAFKKNVFIGFLVLGLLAFVYFYSLLKKKNTTISQQNELNEHTIAILSHDMKEPLLGVKLLLKKLNKDDPFVAQASQSLENQINSVNGILTNLLKMKKLSLVKKDKNATATANAVVKNVIQELNVAIQTKALTVHNELSDDVLLPIAPEKLQIVVHNLLSNAVKYSFPNQQIRIYKEGKGICIQDFGVGLSPEQRSKLMREVTASQRGTSQERGNGLGLFLVGAMLQGEQMKVVFDSPEVGGTIAKVLG
jgi:two-component sensor histidine kinase